MWIHRQIAIVHDVPNQKKNTVIDGAPHTLNSNVFLQFKTNPNSVNVTTRGQP
jgi:hypothetical protein